MDGKALFDRSSRAGGGGGFEGGAVAASVGGALRDRAEHGDQLGAAVWGDGQRRARPRWAGASPRRSLASTRPFWRGVSGTGPSPCADWSANSPRAALKPIIGRCGISFTPRSSASKKTVVASERDRPDVARRRAQWTKRQSGIDPQAPGVHRRDPRVKPGGRLWTKTNMEPLRGWAPKGERLVAKVPRGHLANHDLRRRSSSRPHRGAVADRRSDRRPRFSNLCRERARAHA